MNDKLSAWLEQPLVFRAPGNGEVTIPALVSIAKSAGAMVGSMLVFGELGVGSQYHLPRGTSLVLYALIGWFFIKYLKVWTLSSHSSPKSALLHSLFNALGWSAVCFAITLVAHDDLVWTPSMMVFAHVFTVILASDMLVWTARWSWHFVSAKFHQE
jgi:hypothetical protein